MRNLDESAWTVGFVAGGIFDAACPYWRSSFEALDWYSGWIEGAAAALGPGEATLRSPSSGAAIRHDSDIFFPAPLRRDRSVVKVPCLPPKAAAASDIAVQQYGMIRTNPQGIAWKCCNGGTARPLAI